MAEPSPMTLVDFEDWVAEQVKQGRPFTLDAGQVNRIRGALDELAWTRLELKAAGDLARRKAATGSDGQ